MFRCSAHDFVRFFGAGVGWVAAEVADDAGGAPVGNESGGVVGAAEARAKRGENFVGLAGEGARGKDEVPIRPAATNRSAGAPLLYLSKSG